MRVILQRVTGAEVRVEDAVVGQIAHGLVALVGIGAGDVESDVEALAAKTAALRIFETADGARSVGDVGGEVLVISQFTLLADTRRGNRPSWTAAAPPVHARPLVEQFAVQLEGRGITVARGIFGAHMVVSLVNDGPVTIVLDREGSESTK